VSTSFEQTSACAASALVIRGRAEDDEIAAVLAVLSAQAVLSTHAVLSTQTIVRAGGEAGPGGEAGAWADRASLIGAPVRPGPAGWLGSGRPR
jgi:hypothetical protein